MNNFVPPNIFHYFSSREYLRDVLEFRKTVNPRYSLRAYAQQMGFSGHTLIHFFINGKRPIKSEHLPKILSGLKLKKKEADYLCAMVNFENAKTDYEKEVYAKTLRGLNPSRPSSFIQLDQFKLISQWYHFAILEMTSLCGFVNDASWIMKRLGGKVNKTQIKNALERLHELGLVVSNNEGRPVKTHQSLSTKDGIPSDAVRQYLKDTINLAYEAVEKQSVDERIYNSCSVTIDSSKLKEAQEVILEFRRKMVTLLESEKGDETYQLNIQLFRLTENKGVPVENN